MSFSPNSTFHRLIAVALFEFKLGVYIYQMPRKMNVNVQKNERYPGSLVCDDTIMKEQGLPGDYSHRSVKRHRSGKDTVLADKPGEETPPCQNVAGKRNSEVANEEYERGELDSPSTDRGEESPPP